MSGEKTIILVDSREPVWKSWARDTGSFAWLAGVVWLTNTQMRPSGWINFFVGIAWFTFMLGRATGHRWTMTPEEVREYLDANTPAPEQKIAERREA